MATHRFIKYKGNSQLPELLVDNDLNFELSEFDNNWVNEGIVGYAICRWAVRTTT